MADNGNVLRLTTGQDSFAGGVDSDAMPVIGPDGIHANQIVWGNNLTCRGGGLSPRPGWQRLLIMPVTALWGEAIMYETGAFPYIVCLIGGRVYRVRVDTDNSVEDISALTGLTMPLNELPFMCQGEEFIIIQAGDYTTLPLFYWDDNAPHMRRSNGATQSLGVVSIAAVAPAVGSPVLLTLTSPFTGTTGQTLFINGATYTASAAGNFITLQKQSGAGLSTGTIVPAGTAIKFLSPAAPQVLTTAPFTVPFPGNSVVVAIDNAYTSTVPNLSVNVGGSSSNNWHLTATGLAPAGANQVYVTNLTATPGAAIAIGATLTSAAELPAAGPMDYYMGRLWEANGREYVAGDIVGGPSGTAPFGYRDALLKFTENAFLSLGGAFIVPDVGGNIRALKHPVSLDTARGEGKLFVYTRPRIYSVNVVPTRAEWKLLAEPIQRVAQINFGTNSDRSVVGVNGDLFCQSLDGIRSMTEAQRYFEQWGNTSISTEEARAINGNDRALLRFGSGILFQNRLLQTCLPVMTPVGAGHQGILPLNFDVISTLQQKKPPAWEGIWEGFKVLRLLQGDFGGRERAFAFIYSDQNQIELWELTQDAQFDSNRAGEDRITWVIETPSYNWGQPFSLHELDTLELWLDRLTGTVEFKVQFRPDQFPCWIDYFSWQECAPRNNCEDVGNAFPNPDCYPTQQYRPDYIATVVLPKPPTICATSQGRPVNIGYGFQFRIFITGYCRLRGLRVHGYNRYKAPYEKMAAVDRFPGNTDPHMSTIETTNASFTTPQ